MYRDFIIIWGGEGQGEGILLANCVYMGKNEIPAEDKTNSLLLPVSAANLNKNLKAHNSLLKGHSQSDLT